MKKVDLHIHTIFSDGTLPPDEVVKVAYSCGLSAIAVTDHDEVNGLSIAYEAGKYLGVDVILGVELSTKKDSKSIHILGYFIDPNHPELLAFIDQMRKSRIDRAEKMIHKLNDCGVCIKVSDVKECAGPGVICRPHIAEVLVNKGVVNDLRDAFIKYIGWNKPCYVPKETLPTESVIKLIHKAGGIPVLAHPSISGVDEWIEELVNQGLMGIEVWYPTHSDSDVKRYLELVNKYNLIPTGGSDSHGTREKYPMIGEFWVTSEVLDRLKEVNAKMLTH